MELLGSSGATCTASDSLCEAHARREALHEPLDDELEVFAACDNAAAEARRDLQRVLEHLPFTS